jgi:hypothetical protein
VGGKLGVISTEARKILVLFLKALVSSFIQINESCGFAAFRAERLSLSALFLLRPEAAPLGRRSLG